MQARAIIIFNMVFEVAESTHNLSGLFCCNMPIFGQIEDFSQKQITVRNSAAAAS